MGEVIHRDAASAWAYVRDHGGIELEGRDEGLDARILQRLNPAAPSLDEAVQSATLEAFARAFFEAAAPYLAIFRDVLKFFERAAATFGQHQWTLRIDGYDLGLDHFRQWIEAWNRAGGVVREVPALDFGAVWDLWRILPANGDADAVARDVSDWVDAYNAGAYEPMPGSLTGAACPEELRASASIAEAALARLNEANLNRERLMALYRSRQSRMNASDALDFWTIAQNETDYWLRSFVVALASAARLPRPELAATGEKLRTFLAQFPTRPFEFDVSMGGLQSILSLPLWQKRYELYSVWIATEMMAALQGHQIEFHHENGSIPFAFHETLLATIRSAREPFAVISEKRSPLQNPRGEGRTGGVQPDHGIWMMRNGQTCRLAVEVKHYKKSAKRKFLDALEDYARALTQAEVYLVNHGPVGFHGFDVSSEVRDRCHVIEHLTPSSLEGRQKLARAVQQCVGEPVPVWTSHAAGSAVRAALVVVDVSASIKALMQSDAFERFLIGLASAEQAGELVGVDTAVQGRWPTSRAGFAALRNSGGGSTDLGASVRSLLETGARLVIVTDQDGAATLAGLPVEPYAPAAEAPPGVVVLIAEQR